MSKKIPAQPQHAPDGLNKWRRLFMFRQNMFAALPQRLYRAWMAEVKTPFYSSFLINDPNVSRQVLNAPARDYPKSDTIYNSIKPLLGNSSVFVTNGDIWEMQRRIINPAFEGGRIKTIYPAMQNAAHEMIARFDKLAHNQPVDIEFECSHFAADIIFRTLFSIPINHELARSVFDDFQAYQRAQPVFNFTNLMRLPKWFPRFESSQSKKSAQKIRKAIGQLVDLRLKEIKDETAPQDLATKIMTTKDPETGHIFDREEMIDQVAIFFLAGHETSASALSWALYLLAFDQDSQNKVYDEIQSSALHFDRIAKLKFTRNVFHETLRLYAPVPMLVRESNHSAQFRDKTIAPKDLCILSAWHSGRHERIWDEPHAFKPDRWEALPAHCRDAYFPFSAGERICIGAGFAMIEGVLGIASLVQKFQFELSAQQPVPVAYLTTRSENGIYLRISKRL